MSKNIYQIINQERAQGSEVRTPLFDRIHKSKELEGRKVVSFFTSFTHPVQIDDSDCDALESLLQRLDLSHGLALIISSPGGNGLSAERIVNMCRAYSGTKDFWVIVPGKAKSAATMICMGASKVIMGPAAELGPVDPQIFLTENGANRSYSLHSLVRAYESVLKSAESTTGRIEPYIQQLQKFDVRDIETYKDIIKVVDSITLKVLTSGMMPGVSTEEIRSRVKIFLDPDAGTQIHARPIFQEEVGSCGIKCEGVDIKSMFWRNVYELYARTNAYVNTSVAKAVESRSESFVAPVPGQR